MSKAVKSVANVIGGVVGALTGKTEGIQQPQPEKPQPMPDPEAQQLAKKRSIAAIRARQGRASTIMSDSDSLGV